MPIVIAAVAAAILAPSPAPPREVKIEHLGWSRTIEGPEPITAIEIRNDFGDVRARLAGDKTLEASMVVQRLDPGPGRVGFTVERRGSVIALVVGYPTGHIQDADPHPRKDSYDRLDLTVFVPAGVALRAQSLRGLVEARGLRGDVEARTLEGPILLSASGTIRARTETGDLTVTINAAALGAPGPPLLLETASGPIYAIVPAAGNAELRVETSGALESKIALQRQTTGPRTKATARLGTGERLLLIRSDTGAIRIDN